MKYRMSKTSGSHAHVGERSGRGPVKGAGSVGGNAGPGRTVKTGTKLTGLAKAPGGVPKNIKVQRSGE